jgi:hypothetical protein
MKIKLGKHDGVLHPNGSARAYNIEFVDVAQALRFLDPYPVGPDYVGTVSPDGTIILQIR